MTKKINRRTLLKGTAAGFVAVSFGAQAASHAAKEHLVDIVEFSFVPSSIDVKVGDTIIWTNKDRAPHTASADDDGWTTGTLRQNESGSLEVTSDISSTYHCRFHPNMKAQLNIVAG